METQLIEVDNQQILHLLDNISDALVFTNNAGEIVHLNAPARHLDILKPLFHHAVTLRLEDIPLESIPLDTALGNLHGFRLVPPAPGVLPERSLAAHLLAAISAGPDITFETLGALGLSLILLNDNHTIQALNAPARGVLPQARSGESILTLLPGLREILASPQTGDSPHFTAAVGDRALTGNVLRWEDATGRHTMLVCAEPPAPLVDEFARVGLLRMLIHDLSNPLYIALNFARLLQDNVITGEEVTQATEIIVNNLQRMQDLLTDLSSLEQLGENIASSFDTVELATIAATVVANLDERAQARRVRLRLNPLPAGPYHIQGNERLLSQALHNLVENAIKYSLPGGWVRVTVRSTGQRYEILVADNGIGIAPARHVQLFTPFYRIKDPRMNGVHGTGLGLSLVRMVAAQHRGQVRLYSVPERGSIFVMQLPHSDLSAS